MTATRRFAGGCILGATFLGCTWDTKLPADAAAIHVQRDRELVVTDDAVLSSLSGNASGGALSFRRAMERLSTRGAVGPSTLAWMRAWSQRLRDEGESARADALDAGVTCPWLRRTPANLCADACETCAGDVLALESAPFRLVAVVNRTDLSVMPDRAADGGEGRLVFALTGGPADSSDSPPLPMTVILEYAQQGSAREWAGRWHALGSVSDQEFPAKLTELASAFVETGSIAQIRTGDAVTGALVLHEFHLVSGDLVAANVRNTPDWTAVAEADVRAFAEANAAAIENGTHLVPASWLAESSALDDPLPAYLSTVTSHEALVRGTCAGCHHDAGDRGFQIDPLAHGDQKLTRFLVDPTKDLDEIGRRTEWLQVTLSSN